jgi:peptidyl-prolyl cis-trans isomerase B (cyclophilin B)
MAGTIREVSRIIRNESDYRRAARVAGKNERQRRLARERYERRAARREQQNRRSRRLTISALAAVAVVAVIVGSVFLAGGFSSGNSTAAAASPSSPASFTASASAAPSASATPSASAAASPAAVSEPAHHCAYTVHPPAARKVSFPPATPDYTATYQATIKTNRGDIGIALANSKATCTVNSFVHLAEADYFSSTHCHRLTTSGIFVLQCGDPTGTGSGGPGYEFANENLAGAKYTAGTVAMANAGANTNGSQFFLVYQNSTLAPNYTPFGTINGPGDGHPKDKVEIESVTIKKT